MAAAAPAADGGSQQTVAAQPQERRESREQQGRPPRHKHGPRRGQHNRVSSQQARTERPRDKPIDPNSPFAALAELKARLEAERKPKD